MIRRYNIFLFGSILWALVMFILCTISTDNIPNPKIDLPIDKIVHFVMFFVMALLLCSGLQYQGRLKKFTIYIVTFVICGLYGGTIELVQHYFFNRSAEWGDLLADIIGTFAGCLLAPPLVKLTKRFMNGLE